MAHQANENGYIGKRRLIAERAITAEGACGGQAGKASRSVKINLAESPLGWLAARGRISRRQLDAGEQLRRDWTIAGLAPHITMRWDMGARTPPGSGAAVFDATVAQIDAKRRFDRAITAVGPGLSDALWRVACAGEGLEIVEKALGWPVRAGKVVLGLALDRLADHYRMK